MSKRSGGCWAAVFITAGLLMASSLLSAQDAPHWARDGFPMNCTSSCHVPHQASGSAITQAATNVALCQSCHFSGGEAGLMAVENADKADRTQRTGTSHAFDVNWNNPDLGTQLPSDLQMQLRIMSDNVVCSTCHNQHGGEAVDGGTSRVRPTIKITALGSTGSIVSGGTFTGSDGLWYLIDITSGGNENSAGFRWTNDAGKPEVDKVWVSGLTASSSPQTLTNGVTVTFAAGTFVTGERWEFAGAWPFLRRILDSGDNAVGEKFCRDCHQNWVMTHTAVETWDGGFKSHPVGVGLNANNKNYDRAAPRDGDGTADDGIAGNDLKLDASNNVQCLTCHSAHFADSITETEGVP